MSIPSVPPWLVDLFQQQPWLVPVALLIYAVYRLFRNPIAVATLVAVLGGKIRRKDAKEVVEILCERDDDLPAVTGPPGRPARTGRRARRRRRR